MPKKRTKKASLRNPKRGGFNPKKATLKSVAAQLARQKDVAKAKRLEQHAKAALKSFRARKADRGKIVMIGIKGKRDPQAKGRKGYLAYITKTGKKRLLKLKDEQGKFKPIKPQKISNVQIPFQKNLRRATKEFQSSRLVEVRRGKINRPVIRGSGKVNTGPSAYDFNESVVRRIAKSLQQTISSVKSHRIFLVSVNILVRLADGSQQVFSFGVPIERPDHIAIKLGGIVNWLRKKFYAAMANELRFAGYVSSGSANHIRHLNENYGVTKKNWTQGEEEWRGQDLDIVKIEAIEWKVEQSK